MRTEKIIGGAAAVFVILLPPVSTASAEPTPQPAGHRDYTGIAVSAVGEEQCAEPVDRRAGSWMCLAPAAEQERSRAAAAAAHPIAERRDGHCSAKGCWDVYSAVDSDFHTTGYFGYGGKQLGTAELYFEVKLNGAMSRSKPVYFIPSTSIRSLEIEGERLYYSAHHPEGHPVRPDTWNAYTHGPIGAHQRVDWTPNGYKAYENTVQIGSVVHEWVWTKSGYPGNWWLFGKSVKFNRTSSSYRFGSSTYLGKDPVGAGWHAG